MAKDGTMRGSAQHPGAGRKAKPLAEKILEGKAENSAVLPKPSKLKSQAVPKCDDWMKEKQEDGSLLCAEQVYKDTYAWLKSYGCEKIVNKQLVQQYAMSIARWIAIEQAITKYGYLASHPTTHEPMASPYISEANTYFKQATQIWNQMYAIIRENSSVAYGKSGAEDPMEALLKRKGE